jgi:peptide/nickel transport system substrate-binding protein
MRMRFWQWKTPAILLLFLLAIVGPAAGPGAPAASTVVTVAQGTEPLSLDGNADSSTEALNIYLAMYDALTARDTSGKLIPWLAESWKPVNNNRGWEFTLRKGVKFQNGDPLTADDVVFTLQRIMTNKTSAMSNQVRGITGVTKVDDYTVRIDTNAALPMMPAQFTGLPIVPKKYVEEHGPRALIDNPVGSGPFIFRRYVRGERVELSANPSYWRGRPKVDGAVFLIMPEEASRVAALKTGQADLIRNLSPDLAKAVQTNGVAIKSVISNRSINVMLDTMTFKPFTDRRVRQALNYAVDVDSIIKDVLGGYGVRNSTMVPPGFVGYDPSVVPYKYNPDKAKQLLAEAGYQNGFDLTFQSPNGRYLNDKEVSEAVANYLTKVGIRTQVQTYEWGTYVSMYFGHKSGPIFLIGNGSFTQDALDNLDNVQGGNPYSWYSNPDLDALLTKASSTVDQSARAAIYQQAQRLVYWEAPILFMYTEKDLYGVNAALNWTPRRDEIIWLGDVTKK